MGCHFLLQCIQVKSESEVAQSTPWAAAYQTPLSMGFSRQEYWSGLPYPPPGDPPHPGVKTVSPMSPLLASGFFTTCANWLVTHNPMDCSTPDSSVHGILQARMLEWVSISFSRGSTPPRDRTHISCIAGRFFTVPSAREAP